jgi:hypothetical protein
VNNKLFSHKKVVEQVCRAIVYNNVRKLLKLIKMPALTVYSIIESPFYPDLAGLYRSLGMQELKFNSLRKAISHLKTQLPDIIVADFVYGYGSNYAGANVCNLDVFLRSLEPFGKEYKLIIFVDKEEAEFVQKLHDLFPVSMALLNPVKPEHMKTVLEEMGYQ